MGRFFVIVLILIGIGLVINYAASNDNKEQQSVAKAATKSSGATASPASDDAHDIEQFPAEEIAGSSQPAPPEEVLLGTDELTRGIPGVGPVTADEITKWLADGA